MQAAYPRPYASRRFGEKRLPEAFRAPSLDPQKLKGVKDRSMGAYVAPGGNMHHDRDFKKPKP